MKGRRKSRVFHKAVDGETSRTETRTFRRKLGKDAEVRTEFRKMKRMVKASEKLEAGVPNGFKGRVLKGLRQRLPSKG